MLYALPQPLLLVGLLIGFVVGGVAHALAQIAAAGRRDRLATGGRRTADPRRQLDVFGAIAAAIAGVGWPRPLETDQHRLGSRGRLTLVLLAGPAANLVLAVAGYAALLATGAPAGLPVAGVSDVLLGRLATPAAAAVPLGFATVNLAMAVLSVVPLPPLVGGRLLFAYAPRTSGWRNAEYRLVDQNWGVGIVLVLLLLPLAGGVPLLLFLVDTVCVPLLGLVASLVSGAS